MPSVSVQGVRLEYDVAGTDGTPVIFLHEFGCTKDEWNAQVNFFASSRRVITPNSVGYPPSDVPDEPSAYSIERQVENVLSILHDIGTKKAHVVGHSMGGHVALEFGLRHPEAIASLVLVGAGSGQTNTEGFRKQCLKKAEELEELGLAGLGDYSQGPTRKRFEMKDSAAHRAYFVDAPKGKHSAKGRANTLRGFQATRPVWYDQEEELKQLQVPTLVVVGDEDEPCIAPGLFLKKTLPRCGLCVMPQTGHTIQVEEPMKFNNLLQEFLAEVEANPSVPGRWVPLEGCVNDAFSAAMGGTNGMEPSTKKQRV